ncbi:hypothetical protein [Salinibius halmophilus]|uniref:hypothetical protein n=1 Tax=Salinibius halmophilus TaxID=1853216 RepID=UPI000E666E77|nr:hypothetical protein [Salinibius halmophilus]
MKVTFDQQYITQTLADGLIVMLAWSQLEQVLIAWFAGKPHWLITSGSARMIVARDSEGERPLQDALAQLHNFDAALARQLLAKPSNEPRPVWRKN